MIFFSFPPPHANNIRKKKWKLSLQIMKTLNSTFYSAEKPGSFCSSIDKLRHSLRLQFPTSSNRISNLQIKQWLREQQVHTTHRSARKRYPQAPIVVRGIDDQWELDLVEMIPFSRYNKGFKYILTCIDVLSNIN
jgi:hypothetical protein